MKKHIMLVSTALAVLVSTAVPGLTEEKPAGRLTAELTFGAIDTTGKGYIHQGDLEAFRDNVFIPMDGNEDGKVTYEEFGAWDPGFSAIAAEEGKADAYVTASKIVFAFWDRNGDGALSAPEMRFAMSQDFRRADLNDDGVLNEDEFLSGFAVIVAMRAAIRPDL